jgi:vacuolar-type H+-ATPase subunit E/Vma4
VFALQFAGCEINKMKELENLLKKIEEEVYKKVEKLNKEKEQKKFELEEKYKRLIEEKKKELDFEYKQKLELKKKRVYTEKFIEHNKKIEGLKNQLLKKLLEKIKINLINIEKDKYYKMIKNIILKNIFLNEQNVIIFDKTNKLTKNEKQKLVNDVLNEISKNNNSTKIVLSAENGNFEFGVKIVSKEKLKEFTLENIVEIIKPYAEEEINNLISKQQK